MISPRVLTAAWLLNRDWPMSQVVNGKAAAICWEAMKVLSVGEFKHLLLLELLQFEATK